MNKEIEIKIKIDQELFKNFTKNKPFHFEKTYGYFTENYGNMVKGIFPRIKDMGNTALVSVKVKVENNSKMFERDEYEFEIESSKVESARLMFKALGYCIEHVFEKRRYILESLNNCDFVIDELPFGYFVELEGSEEDIEKEIHGESKDKWEVILNNPLRCATWERKHKGHWELTETNQGFA